MFTNDNCKSKSKSKSKRNSSKKSQFESFEKFNIKIKIICLLISLNFQQQNNKIFKSKNFRPIDFQK